MTNPSTEPVHLGDDTADLLARARSGDRSAFDKLHARYARAILGYIRTRLLDEDDAQDVSQDTWAAVWEKLPTYDAQRSSFVTFVKYWAGIMLLRAYARRDRRRGVEMLARGLLKFMPELEDAEGTSDILERLAARTEPESEAEQLTDVYAELLRATFASASPPHQLVVFGFVKCLGWTPRRVAAELSDVLLSSSSRRLEDEYLDVSQLPPQSVEVAFQSLRARLQLRFGEVVSDPRTRATFPALIDRMTGETCLRDYYTGDDATADLTQWWYAVYRRVRGEVQRRSDGPLFRLASARAARKVAGQRM
jgi:RNA polymerase sigma factor (sigma-70 family)